MKPLIRESWHLPQPKEHVKYGRVEIELRDAFGQYADVRANLGQSSETIRVVDIERAGGPAFSGRAVLTVMGERVLEGNVFISYEPAVSDKDRKMISGLLAKVNFVKNGN